MKTYRFKTSMQLLLCLLLLATTSYAQEREKRVNRTFDVSPSTRLKISNKFGRVHVNTWDKSQIQAEVVIRAEMRNDDRTQEFLNSVEIDITESSSLISLATDFKGKTNSRKGESFTINYTISMPATGDLDIENKFGDIYVDDLSGDLFIDLKYGNMKGDKLTGKSDIEIGFGGGTIEEVANSDMNIKYSNLKVLKAQDVDLDQQFSDVRIDELKDMELRSKYGSVELGLINSVDGSAGFTDFEIDEVISEADLDLEYVGGFRINKLRKGFSQVKLDAKFTSMELSLEDGVTGEFSGVFRFCDLQNRGEGELDLNYIVKDMHRNEYKGIFGGGGNSRISVDSGYGDLKIDFVN